MTSDNLISIEISPDDLAKVSEAIKTIEGILLPQLKNLSRDERVQLAKMGDKTVAFVQKTLDYSETYPQFLPPFMDANEFRKDLAAVNTLNQINRPLTNLSQMLNDSILMAGSDAYIAALSYYNTVKQAAKMNISNAKTIFEDLRQRFSGRSTGRKESGE